MKTKILKKVNMKISVLYCLNPENCYNSQKLNDDLFMHSAFCKKLPDAFANVINENLGTYDDFINFYELYLDEFEEYFPDEVLNEMLNLFNINYPTINLAYLKDDFLVGTNDTLINEESYHYMKNLTDNNIKFFKRLIKLFFLVDECKTWKTLITYAEEADKRLYNKLIMDQTFIKISPEQPLSKVE